MPSVTVDKTPTDLVFDADAIALVPKNGTTESPVFSVRHLDYYEVQRVYAADEVEAQTRVAFEIGLISIDGDKAQAEAFVEAPIAQYGGALWRYLWDHAMGN